MRLLAILTASAMLTGCAAHTQKDEAPALSDIVSLDLCADQMVLRLVEKGRIKAVSNEAELDDSFAGVDTASLPRVRPTVEEIIALRPAIVVKSYGGGPLLDAQLTRLGIKVVQLDYAARLSDIPGTIDSAAQKLGTVEQGQKVIRRFQQQLVKAGQAPSGERPSLLYVTPGGVTTGPGSLIDDAITASGFRNYNDKPGWYGLPLEALAGKRPDAVLTGFFDKTNYDQDAWSSARHKVTQRALRGVPAVQLPGSKVSCGNWLIGDVVEDLSVMRGQMQ